MSRTFNIGQRIAKLRPLFRVQMALLPTLALFGAGIAIAPVTAEASTPQVEYTTLVEGISNPWDVTFIDDTMIYTLRGGEVWTKRGDEAPRKLEISGWRPTYAKGEAGLMGVIAHPQAASNGNFYTCRAVAKDDGSPLDIRVERWKWDGAGKASADGTTVDNLPLNESGRHSGCRMGFGKNNLLYIGTGDAAVGTNPQDLQSLGGKLLRVGDDGTPPKYNPFYGQGGDARYVLSYGHRNIQGVAIEPGTLYPWTAEHGPDVNDEVNVVWKGKNYGWDPVPGYNEKVPMTDREKYPEAQPARWATGDSTLAISGATFLNSPQWGDWDGWLAVAALKGQQIRLLQIDSSRRVVKDVLLPNSDKWGRVRTVQQGPDGDLYVTTADKILRVSVAG